MSEEDLQIAVKRRQVKSKRERERYTQLNAEFQRIARRDKNEGLLFLHGLESNPGSSLQTEEEAGLP